MKIESIPIEIQVLIILSVIHLLEAWLEEVVIDLKNPNLPYYTSLNHQEHFRSSVLAVAWLIPAVYVACYNSNFWIIPGLVVNRRIFFDYGLILFRDRPGNKYEGNDWWVMNIFIPIFGRLGRIKELVLTALITAASIYLTLKN
jgi:general stress protein CsbA